MAKDMPLTRDQKIGGLAAFGAYTLWGLAALYFKQLAGIPPAEILMHRVVWSCLLLILAVTSMRGWPDIWRRMRQPALMAGLSVCAMLLAFNWWLFIWAMVNDRMLDASLGYYINPLFNVLLGMLFLRERLRRAQWLAVGLAGAGLAFQIVVIGALPRVALGLAGSFAIYGLLRKKLMVDATSGLLVESLLLLPAALFYWWRFADPVTANLFNNTSQLNLLLMSAGLVTTVPLLCFVAGARRLQLATMGFFQYIGPSLMFVFGVLLYREPVSHGRMTTFVLIWSALAIYTFDAWQHGRNAMMKNNKAA